jgi:hypothetical protein
MTTNDQIAALAALERAKLAFAPDYIPYGGSSFWGQTKAPLVFAPHLFFRYREDFIKPQGSVVATTLQPFGWRYIGDGNGNVTSVDGAGGRLQIACTASANDEQYLSLDGFTTGGNDFFNVTANSGKALWAEFKVRASSITNGAHFAGFATHAANAANFMADTTTEFADVGLFGFAVDHDAPTQWIWTHKASGQTVQESTQVVANDATNDVRLQLHFDGGTTLKVFANDVKLSTEYSVSAATFPTGVAMVPMFGVKNPAGAARNLQIDYLDIIQGR